MTLSLYCISTTNWRNIRLRTSYLVSDSFNYPSMECYSTSVAIWCSNKGSNISTQHGTSSVYLKSPTTSWYNILCVSRIRMSVSSRDPIIRLSNGQVTGRSNSNKPNCIPMATSLPSSTTAAAAAAAGSGLDIGLVSSSSWWQYSCSNEKSMAETMQQQLHYISKAEKTCWQWSRWSSKDWKSCHYSVMTHSYYELETDVQWTHGWIVY